MAQRTLIELLVVFLGLSYALSSSATRSPKSTKEDPSVQEHLVQGAAETVLDERRMDIELLDYQESSASHQHDPKPPGGRA